MAQKTQPNLVQPVATPQHYVPATARELRAQAVYRLQIGLFGLAAMLLLVGLANIIMDRARLAEDAAAPLQPRSADDSKAGNHGNGPQPVLRDAARRRFRNDPGRSLS